MLATYINERQIKTVKSVLLHHGRGTEIISSSHLSEALAFALGFNTNAAMRAKFQRANVSHCVSFCVERFWRRLSELSHVSVKGLLSALSVDVHESVCRATATRDLREKVALPPAFKTRLDRLFEVMADHGVAYYTIAGARLAPNALGWGGFYRPGRHAMRPRFSPSRSSLDFQWSSSSASALAAEDVLEDHMGEECDLLQWAMDACNRLEPELALGNVVYNAEIGLVVHHEEIGGCTASIVHQRPGQLERVRDADARRVQAELRSA